MKKTTLLLIATMLIPMSFSHAGNHGGKGHFMKHMAHANPVPNYVGVIKKNSDALDLSEKQMEQVMAWRKANKDEMHKMVMSVIEQEKKIKQASLNGTSAKDILAMVKRVNEIRYKIVEGKTRCRDRMMSILNKEQWKELTSMVKHMSHKRCENKASKM